MTREADRCRIVICDDQAHYRRLVVSVIELDPDLEVVGEAANGREAVELAERLRPDLLLLDLAMPVMDGLEALPLIRAAAPETRVVILSGVTAPSSRARAAADGASGFIEKGTDIDAFVRELKELSLRDPRG